MKHCILCLLLCLCLTTAAAHAGVQDQINALPPAGGEVKLGCGVFNEAALALRDGVALIGSGVCTVVPSIGIANSGVRHYNLRVENLTVDGAIDGAQYIGIDFRNASTSRIRNVAIRNVQVGVLFYQQAYYNTAEDVVVDASVNCFEVTDGANENTVRGGRCQHPTATRLGTGIWVRNANNVKVFGTSAAYRTNGQLKGPPI